MAALKILWVDDDINAVSSIWEPELKEQVGADLKLSVEKLRQGLGVLERITDEHFDLLILDVELGDGDDVVPTAWRLLERMRGRHLTRRTILFSNHIVTGDDGRYASQLESYRAEIIGAFAKSPDGLRGLTRCLKEYAHAPPISMVVVSDLHFGLHRQSRDSYLDIFTQDLETIRPRWQPDHFIALGDFAWQGDAGDLDFSARFVGRACSALKLHGPGALHFCPGNHDIALNSTAPWQAFQHLVERLADRDPSILERYGDSFHHAIRAFRDPEDLVALGVGAQPGVVFASLNSVDPSGHARRVTRLGRRQLDRLKHSLKALPRGYDPLRVALLHHPLFPVPGEQEEEEEGEDPILIDSARVFRDLNQLGFQLVMNGHSHYSCVHEHRVAVLNRHPHAGPSQQSLAVVSVATLGGQPSSATPYRQYGIVRIGHRQATGCRLVTLSTRVYSAESRTFSDGDATEVTLKAKTEDSAGLSSL